MRIALIHGAIASWGDRIHDAFMTHSFAFIHVRNKSVQSIAPNTSLRLLLEGLVLEVVLLVRFTRRISTWLLSRGGGCRLGAMGCLLWSLTELAYEVVQIFGSQEVAAPIAAAACYHM